jgi:hypothetical protein
VGVNAGGENVDGNRLVDRTADIRIDNFKRRINKTLINNLKELSNIKIT